MAIAFSQMIHSGHGAWATTPYASASFTPVAGRIYLIDVEAAQVGTGVGTIDTPTFSGSGLTISAIAGATQLIVSGGAEAHRKAIFKAVASGSPTSGTISVGVTGSFNYIYLRISEYTGCDTTTPVNESNVQVAVGTSQSPSVTMGTFADGNSAAVGFFHLRGDGDPVACTAATNWTEEAAEIDPPASSITTVASVYRIANDNPALTHNLVGGYNWGMIGLELKAAGGAAEYEETLSESAAAADTIAGELIAGYTLSEPVVAVDAITDEATGQFEETLSEPVIADEQLTDNLIVENILSEAPVVDDAIPNPEVLFELPDETGALADQLADQLIVENVLSDAGTAADELTEYAIIEELLSEIISGTDAINAEIVTAPGIFEEEISEGVLAVISSVDEAIVGETLAETPKVRDLVKPLINDELEQAGVSLRTTTGARRSIRSTRG